MSIGRALRFVSFGLVAATAISGCDSDGGQPGSIACGDAVCGPHQTCAQGSEPTCVCDEAYTGDSCEACAPGYVESGSQCTPAPLDCDDGNPCGAYGTCVDAARGDHCECTSDHAGRTCALCAEGLQDNDANGTCTTACSHAELACASWEACDDSTGTVSCGCSPHSTGRHCDECEDGYYRLADGPCVKYCDYAVTCSEPQSCKEVEGKDAACACPLGSEGEDCGTCSEGFSAMAGGACGRLPSGGGLLVGSTDTNWDYLAELDLASKSLTLLRSGIPYVLSPDRTRHELWAGDYVTNGSTFGRYDIASGSVSTLAASKPFNSTATFDPSRRAVFWVVPDDLSGLAGTLMRFDVDTSNEVSLGHVNIRSSDYMVYDIHNDRLISTTWDSGLVLVIVDPDSGALSTLGRPLFETNGTNPRLAVDDAGQIYLLASIQRSPSDGLKDMLSSVFTRLGLPPISAEAPVTLESRYWSEPTMPITLASASTNGAQVVAYDSHGDSHSAARPEPTPLTIAVKNPDAVLSITTLKENFRIQVAADARFKNLLIYAGPDTEIEFAPGFEASPSSIVVIGKSLPQDSLEAQSPALRTYTTRAINDRRAPIDVYYDDSDDDPPLWLVRVDPVSMAATLVQRMPQPTDGSTLAVF